MVGAATFEEDCSMATQSTRAAVENFVGQRKLAVVGVSRDTKKFGNAAYKSLKEKGYQVYPINRNVETIEGDRCYASLDVLPEKVDGVVIVVPPVETEKVVREAEAAGIKNVWMQQGAESDEAIRYCQEHGLSEVHGECIIECSPRTAQPCRQLIQRSCIDNGLHLVRWPQDRVAALVTAASLSARSMTACFSTLL
jgi:predicted CoA-binding protein